MGRASGRPRLKDDHVEAGPRLHHLAVKSAHQQIHIDEVIQDSPDSFPENATPQHAKLLLGHSSGTKHALRNRSKTTV